MTSTRLGREPEDASRSNDNMVRVTIGREQERIVQSEYDVIEKLNGGNFLVAGRRYQRNLYSAKALPFAVNVT
jgi:hypothetical protein